MNSQPEDTGSPNTRNAHAVLAIPRMIAMLMLFASAALFEATHLTCLTALANNDIWWHLRTGIWILQNHAAPQNGLFSQSVQSPWSAPGWFFDVILACAHRRLDLSSIPIVFMTLKFVLALLTFLLGGGMRGRFWSAVVLSAIAQYLLARVPLSPTYASSILFAIELLLLLASRRARSMRPLFWLPLLFLVWANIDDQFVYGIFLFALFLLTSFLQSSGNPKFSPKPITSLAVLSLIATLVTPYSYHPYASFFASAVSAANHYLPDFQSMGFRQPQDYLLMLLTMSAFLALGLRRSRDCFQIALMIGCTMLSFYAQRYVWLSVLAAIMVIADALGTPDVGLKPNCKWPLLTAAGLSVASLLIAAATLVPRHHDFFLAKIAQVYPVAASDFIRDHQLPQPLFNAYEWGGFLTWYLPEYPVAIDGRTDLYSADFVTQYSKAMNADTPYTAFPPMNQAGTLLLLRNSLMGQALSSVPAFRVAYSDNVSVVLTKP